MSTTETTAGHGTKKRAGIKVSPKLITVGVIVVAAIWFILVNKGRVAIYLWVPKVTAPMWLVLLLTFVGGLLAGLLIRRRGKRA
jgi:lipopolysaccharide assembly protein A